MNKNNSKIKLALVAAGFAMVMLSGCSTQHDPSVEKKVVRVEEKEGDPVVEVSRDTRVTTSTETELVPAPPTSSESTTTTTTDVKIDTPEPASTEPTTEPAKDSSESSMTEPNPGDLVLAEVTFSEDRDTVSQELSGQAVTVSSTGANYNLTGEVTGLSITGSENTIVVESADNIEVSGDKNRIKYGGTTPIVTDSGTGNLIEEKK